LTFRSFADYTAGVAPTAAATGDFNGDGTPDVGTASDVGISVLIANTDGTLRAEVQYGTGPATAVATADFDGDGKMDLVDVRRDTNNTVGVYLGRGDGTFQPRIDGPPGSAPVGGTQSSLATADFDGDGKIDVALASSTGKVSVFRGAGTGAFGAPVTYSVQSPWSVKAGDFNGDAKVDLVVASFGAQSVSVFLGKGDGSFAAPV